MTTNGQLIVFGLDNQRYALPIHNVSEIIRNMEVTRLPNRQHYYTGIINLRGAVVPVINLHLRLGLEEGQLGKDARIIVTEANDHKIGFIVDNVYSVTTYNENEVDKPETFAAEEQHIMGIVHHEDGMILLLDLQKIN